MKREDLAPQDRQHFDGIAGSRGRVGNNFAALLNSAEATGRLAAFGEYVRFHSEIPEPLKELAILCAAREANNPYVWTAHERLAREKGVADAVINAIRDRSAPGGMRGDEARVVRYAKELLTMHQVSDDTFGAVHRLLGNQRTVELTLLTMYYSTLAHALQALKVDLPAGTTSTL
jgi:4-carboxymuconolactone decarboxylase